jgi:hypothetical protein
VIVWHADVDLVERTESGGVRRPSMLVVQSDKRLSDAQHRDARDQKVPILAESGYDSKKVPVLLAASPDADKRRGPLDAVNSGV